MEYKYIHLYCNLGGGHQSYRILLAIARHLIIETSSDQVLERSNLLVINCRPGGKKQTNLSWSYPDLGCLR